MQSTLLIEGRMFGRNRSLFPDWSMPAPPEWQAPGSPLTLRDLIAGVVRAEVASFRERREQRRLVHVLTETQIAECVARGKVDMGGREEAESDADPEQAVATALLAFEDGLYYVFVDAEHRLDLDEEIRLRAESRVTFLRLVALAGG